jgi:hypothetical protein
MAEMLLHLSADVDDLPLSSDDEKESSTADQMLLEFEKARRTVYRRPNIRIDLETIPL